jgi:hypothetical protein
MLEDAMSRDDIIRMALEAGSNLENGFLLRVTGIDEDLERFAALVSVAEREACAKVCEDKNTLLAWPTYAAAIRARGQS